MKYGKAEESCCMGDIKTMNCVMCGGKATKVKEQRSVKYRDDRVVVSTEFYRCDDCREAFLTPEQARQHARDAKNEVRKKKGLLSPESIEKIRTKLKLTQGELEELLGTGPKVVVRWESGKVIQSSGHDTTLRLLDREPGMLKQLREIQKLRSHEQTEYENSHKPRAIAARGHLMI
jgi:HTH-type transcriptional regulator / antitoxin MqsA